VFPGSHRHCSVFTSSISFTIIISRIKILNITMLKQLDKFKYLGKLIISDGSCISFIKPRTAVAKTAFLKMRNIWCRRSLSIEVIENLLKFYIELILLYGSEAWTLETKARTYLENAEMWFDRRMLRTSLYFSLSLPLSLSHAFTHTSTYTHMHLHMHMHSHTHLHTNKHKHTI
jgi:hypothetical protein